jgi:hypothetical protein
MALGATGYVQPYQAVVKIITNETEKALNILAKQSNRMRNAVCQNCLALHSLLALEGGVCGKFNFEQLLPSE